ncbi:MAG TPA: hypothetical protein VJB66_03935 [Candidatus Nanoarchaeia archaeon]|nr:hypothetical protein [Candidatus Nanoarchaeia archaeon]
MVLYVPRCIQEGKIITPQEANLATLLEQAADEAELAFRQSGFDLRNDTLTFRFFRGSRGLLHNLKLWFHGDPHIGIYSSAADITVPYHLRSYEIVGHTGSINDFSPENTTSIVRGEASEDERWFALGDQLLNGAAAKYNLLGAYVTYMNEHGPSPVLRAAQFLERLIRIS